VRSGIRPHRELAGAILILALLAANPATAQCRKFSVWRYPWPQRCFTAQRVSAFAPIPPERTEKPSEQITIPLPPLLFEVCQDGDERLRGIAKLRGLMDAR
jgi:hypothetical protein